LFDRYLLKVQSTTKITKPLKVVIDCGNGVAGKFAATVLKSFGIEVIELYCELDGTFPNHEANPEKESTLEDLKKEVLKNKADLGIGFDGDGDRVGIIGDDGKFYPAEYILMLLARHLLSKNPGEKILFDCKVSNTLIDNITKHGGQPIMFRTGHSFIKQKLKADNITLAGEKSGHTFFGQRFYNWFGFDDAIFAALKILEALSVQEKTFSETFSDLPILPALPELKIPCPDQFKAPIIEQLTKKFQQTHECITIDGVRIKFSDTNWALIRYSNTSPYLTIFAEAATEEELAEIKENILKELKAFPELSIS